MFRFIKKCFFTAVTFINFKLSTVNSLEYVSMNNQEYKIRTEIINFIVRFLTELKTHL